MSRHPVALYAAVVVAAWLVVGTVHAATGISPEAPSPERQPQSRPDVAPRSPAPAQRQPRMSDRCNTPAVNCILSDPQRAGSACWCVTPFGPSYGRVP
jgi:hypothetical protein